MSDGDYPKITNVMVRPVAVPMARPLYTASGAIEQISLVLIDVTTSDGITGRSYLFAFNPHIQQAIVALLNGMAEMIHGDEASPFEIERKLRSKHHLVGVHNMILFAISGIDMALWDAYSQSVDKPLAIALGGVLKKVQAYNSNGLGLMPVESLANESEQLLSEGFTAIKLRLGRDNAQDDIAAVRAVKNVRCRLLDEEGGLLWIEEPIAADNFSGLAKITETINTPISIGENFMGIEQMQDAIRNRCCDFVMPDVQRIAGVTGWMRAAALADAADMEMSSHLFPEYSCHLLSVTPTSHWLEYVDWATPLIQEPLEVKDGLIQIPEKP